MAADPLGLLVAAVLFPSPSVVVLEAAAAGLALDAEAEEAVVVDGLGQGGGLGGRRGRPVRPVGGTGGGVGGDVGGKGGSVDRKKLFLGQNLSEA